MTGDGIVIKVDVSKVIAAFNKFPKIAKETLVGAGNETYSEVISTVGLKRYPPADGANAPPPPFYKRGVGMVYKSGPTNNSERYGTKFTGRTIGWSVFVGNTASYARLLTGKDTQSPRMAARGWRRLWDVAQEKISRIQRIYQLWVDRALRNSGL